jgi:CRISPR-associated endonuclease/helicase Cas3
VSTLRGEFADNREWSRDPLRPAIIVGTVDMVGSRLLFSGYGDSIRRRALHAGLLGNDALIVNDEAHLTPAFAALLSQVGEMSGARSMLLSATPRDGEAGTFPETMENDLANPIFEKRYRSVKRLHLCEHEEPKKELLRLASEPVSRTLVFRSPEDARKIASHIESKNGGAQPALLTGTQRGFERDQLSKNEVVQRFRSKDAPDAAAPCWLVATSAGEVGIDLSSDRLITDLDTADHLLQRFGRLNRFGETEGDAYVVYSPKQLAGERAHRLRATLDYLRSLPDVSTERLRTQPPPSNALSPAPNFAPILPWHIDVWSMTSFSVKDWPSRPAVEYWLRGEDEEASPPETYVAWREDIADLAEPGIAKGDLEEVFERYPVIAQERLKVYSHRLRDDLRASKYLDRLVIMIGSDGEVYSDMLGKLIEDERQLHYATLVLPPGSRHGACGGSLR